MKQHSAPVIIQGKKSVNLKKVPLESISYYNEDWIQGLCFNHPSLLPIAELEPAFDGMIPICRELSTKSGFVDLLYINDDGFITIGECKLWRNPEAHRKVIGQILDYAKDLAKWDYSKFESECLKARKGDEKTLFEISQQYNPDIEEAYFIDNVQKNLKKGRFLLLVIGDGIRENMEEMVRYIHRSENLHFTMGLVELPVFKRTRRNEEETNEDELIITPRILAKTKEIERIIYVVSDNSIEEEKHSTQENERSQSISEKVFFERLEKNIGSEKTKEFGQLITTLDSMFNIKISLGKNKTRSINFKTLNGYNLITIFETGEVYFYTIWTNISKDEYLSKIATVIKGQISKEAKWATAIRKQNGQVLDVADLLEIKEEWISILTETINEIYQSEEEGD